MTGQKFINVTTLSGNFTGEAANEELHWPHLVLLADMDADIPIVMEHFAEDMLGVFKQMNLDAALARQAGEVDGEPLHGETPICPKTELTIWKSLPLPIWKVVIESYQEHLWNHDTEKFMAVYQTISGKALHHFLNSGEHLDETAVRHAFENSYKGEMKMLRLLTDMLSHHLPQARVTASIHPMGDTPHVTPLITLTAKSGYDLRDIMRQYIDKRAAPGLRPV